MLYFWNAWSKRLFVEVEISVESYSRGRANLKTDVSSVGPFQSNKYFSKHDRHKTVVMEITVEDSWIVIIMVTK